MRYQYYELTPIRLKMMSHKYMDKQEMAKDGKWKWVFHVREEKPRVYSRFWKVRAKEEKAEDNAQK